MQMPNIFDLCLSNERWSTELVLRRFQPLVPLWFNKEHITNYAPIAQLDRALVYGTKGWGFELLWAHQKLQV